jgi:hypothetical protein
MQLVKPLPFDEAVRKLGDKSLIGSALMSAEWRDVPVALRERAFFSSQVESIRFLQRGRDGIADFLQSNREVLPDGQSALKTGSRADFVKQAQDFLRGEGIERTTGELTDLAGERRLGLIFDTQVRQANDYGYWRQGQDADVLDAFPAQRFIRVLDVKEPRNSHTEFEDQVYLKSDPIWALINEDFGVPWGPWGWGCGHDVEDVSREEAEALGLLQPGEAVKPDEVSFNENLRASTNGLDPDLLAKLRDEFGDQLVIEGDTMRWSQSLPSVKPPALTTPGLDNLATEWKTATPAEREILADQARRTIEIPAPARKPVNLTMTAKAPAVQAAARRGAEIVSRYVSPNLVARTKIEVVAYKGRRAFHRRGQIHINGKTSASTVAHEIIHGVEIQNAEVLAASAKFLYSRAATAELPQRQSKLTGNSGYSADEIALEDKWKERGGSVYAGKVYSNSSTATGPKDIRATEVLTMGIERLHADPLEFYTNDRHWFDFVVNTLRTL